MNIFKILSRLGILRFGAKAGTYRNAAERPTEIMMDDVYDAERDLIGGESHDKKGGRPGDKQPDRRRGEDS